MKILIPLLLVVAMSMLTFFIRPEELEAQVAIGSTSLLSIIAFHFVIRDQLPDVGYLTKADVLMIGSYITIFLALVESVMTNLFFKSDRPHLAGGIDKLCRYVFPVLYCAFVCVLAVT